MQFNIKYFLALTISICYFYTNAQTLAIAAPTQTICTNGSATAAVTTTQTGATSYTWVAIGPANCFATYLNLGPGYNGENILITYPCCGTWTLNCFAYSGVLLIGNPAIATVSVSCISIGNPTISSSVPGGSTMCSGPSITLSAIGGMNYTWSPGSSNSNSVVLTPSITTCYSVFTSNSQGCLSYDTICVTVIPTPTLTFTGDSLTCLGSSVKLGLDGATMFFLNPPGVMLTWDTVLITPTQPISTYTLDGANLNCFAQNPVVITISAMPLPTLSVLSSGTVCLGSSLNYTVNGANSYTWINNNSMNTQTINFIPMPGTTYTVAGKNINGCIDSLNIIPVINLSCANVWPGDANRDGIVSNTDVFELGLAANISGPARTSTSIAWTSHFASAWSGNVSTGWNQAHADCNGDGIVNAADNTAITQNFALTHSFKINSINSSNADIHLVPASTLVFAGSWNRANIMLGDASTNLTQLYGVAFDVDFDQSLVQSDSVRIDYTSSFLNATSQNIEFGKTIFSNNKYYAASVRVDHNNVSGNGKIGEFWYKLNNSIPANSVMNLSVSNAVKVSAGGSMNNLTTGSASVSISNSPVGLNETLGFENSFSVYPNPASHFITLRSGGSSVFVHYLILDVIGRELMNGGFHDFKNIDISELEQGAYLIRFESGGSLVHRKFVVE